MAALVQPFPQPSTVTMLQTRPSTSPAPFQSSGQQNRGSRNMYGGGNNNSGYRGHGTVAPVAPYAFTATPSLSTGPRQAPHLRLENRAKSAPNVATAGGSKQRQMPSSPVSVNIPIGGLSDDMAIPSQRNTSRPISSNDLTAPPLSAGGNLRPSPNRYRRNKGQGEGTQSTVGSVPPSLPAMAPIGSLYAHPVQSQSSPTLSPNAPIRVVSQDDSAINRQSGPESAKRYRRRSITLNGDDAPAPTIETRPTLPPLTKSWASVVSTPYVPEKQQIKPFAQIARPSSAHSRNGSDHSAGSSRSASRPSSAKREVGDMGASTTPTGPNSAPAVKPESKQIQVPPRGSSEANKKLANPSPLSKPMALTSDEPASQSSFTRLVQAKTPQPNSDSHKPTDSPAAQHLTALSKKEGKKEGKPSRLRRAFSFGSAAELRKASAENSHAAAERTRLKKQQFNNEEEAREAAIVQQQEASGLGEGIYSGQGHFFTGSTDNLSISSTASSASIMLRKMGKGMKKSTRSLVGLFRPKSVIGVPAADASVPEPSAAQVSMVTVEAEREKVNVNLDPHDQAGGGTGYPRLERNSIDTGSVGEPSLSFSDRSTDSGKPRRSIVGGEIDRAEVLKAVKKGILKRNGTDSIPSSPHHRPADIKSPEFVLPQIPRFTESPHSSAPSTPVDDNGARGHRRTDSVTIEGEDYFMSVARFAASDAKSLPGTPRSMVRNISFSPRIQFHDTWPSGEYDRRGEIATCNRLTPTLAQAIKEELNTFKMEMEVHEQSKVYTHFF